MSGTKRGQVKRRIVMFSLVTAVLAVCLVAFRTTLLRWVINSLVLSGSGLHVSDAQSLSLNIGSLVSGPIAYSGEQVRFQHNLLASPLLLQRIDGTADLSAGIVKAQLLIGDFPGRLSLEQKEGAVRSAELHIGDGGASSFSATYASQQLNGVPALMLKGRKAAPIMAAVLARPRGDLASLPDHIDVELRPDPDGHSRVRYTILGERLDIRGSGDVDLDGKSIVHDAAVRWQPGDDAAADQDSMIGAVRSQLSLVLRELGTLLQQYTVRNTLLLTVVGEEGDATQYRLLLEGGEPDRRPALGRLHLALGDVTLLDAALRLQGNDEFLALSGTTHLDGLQRPVEIHFAGSTAHPLDGIRIVIGEGKSPLTLDGRFQKTALGGKQSLTFSLSGDLSGLRDDRPETAPVVRDAISILKVADVALQEVALSAMGEIQWQGDAVTAKDVAARGQNFFLRLNGSLAPHSGAPLSIEVEAARIDLSAPARRTKLVDAISRLSAALASSSGTASDVRINGRIGTLQLTGQRIDGVDIAYSPETVRARIKQWKNAEEVLASDLSLDLALPLSKDAVIAAKGVSLGGPLHVRFRPNDASSLEQIWSGGGIAELEIPGVAAKAVLTQTPSALVARAEARIDRPDKAPVLARVLGDNRKFWPNEAVSANLEASWAGQVEVTSLTLASETMRLAAKPAGTHSGGGLPPLQVDFSGSTASLFHSLGRQGSLPAKNQPVRASFLWRQAVTGYVFEQIKASLGGLSLHGGLTWREGGALSGNLTLQAQKANDIAVVLPDLHSSLPATLHTASLTLPVNFQSGATGTIVQTDGARLGPLVVSSRFSVAGGNGSIAGSAKVAGPIATTLITDTPAWFKDLLGARQTLSAQVVVTPGKAIQFKAMQLDSQQMRMKGHLDLPISAGAVDWQAADGELSGEIDSFQLDAIRLPPARYSAEFGAAAKGDALLSAILSFPGLYGGAADVRLAVVQPASGQRISQVQLMMRDIDLSTACRNAGLRLLGAGRLNASISGTAPASALSELRDGETVLESLLRVANGSGQIVIRDGILNEVSLEKRAQGSGDAAGGVAPGNRTVFQELSGQLALSNSVLRIEGGRFRAPNYSLDVAGTADLPRFSMNFLVKGQVPLLSRTSTGQVLVSSPIVPLAIKGTPSKPSYEFLPGQLPAAKTVTSTVISGVETVDKIDASLERTQKKVDKYVSDRFFRPLLGKKKAATTENETAQADQTPPQGSVAQGSVTQGSTASTKGSGFALCGAG